MNRKKKMICGIAGAAALAAVMIGGTYAYLTDFDTASNEFTVGKVDIDIEEPNWDPEDHKELLPTQEINKDPMITNKGNNEAYVYMEVSVPIRNVITSDAAGNRIDAAETELFSFSPDNKNWTRIDSYVKGTDKVYIFSYNEILKPSEKTTPLFQTMTFANVVEGQIDNQTFLVPVRAYAIQTANTGGEGESVPEQARNAFYTYLNQNKGLEGQVTEKG